MERNLYLLYIFRYFLSSYFEVEIFDRFLIGRQISIQHLFRNLSQLFYVFLIFPYFIIHYEFYISFFLLSHIGMHKRNFPAEKNFENRSWSSLGNDYVRNMQEVMEKIYEFKDLDSNMRIV